MRATSAPPWGVKPMIANLANPGQRPRHGRNVVFTGAKLAQLRRQAFTASIHARKPAGCRLRRFAGRTDCVFRGRGGGGKPSARREKVPKLPRGGWSRRLAAGRDRAPGRRMGPRAGGCQPGRTSTHVAARATKPQERSWLRGSLTGTGASGATGAAARIRRGFRGCCPSFLPH
jgi:hypothetical protein